MDAALREAQKMANAVDDIVLIGVRPQGKGWFARCQGCEWDGSTPLEAVKAVVANIERLLRQDIQKADDRQRRASNSLTDLIG